MKNIAPALRRSYLLQVLILVFLTPGLVFFPVRVSANPHGQNVVAGNVNFQGLGTSHLDINNLSNRAIINWQSFSIQKGETTNINQGANAFTLNRVVSGNPTAIYGQLNAARGGVAVINPNGIVVHDGGTIDVAGMLTLSTLDITNKDFLNGGADRFQGKTAAAVKNYGTITSSSGDVVLLGNFLQNAGDVNAPNGVVAFGAGGDIVVDQAGGAKISVKSGGAGGEIGVENGGNINAAAAELKAHGNVYALAIKNDGVIRASGYNFSGGKLTLSAGSGGRIVNTGTLQARNADGSGGRISVSGGQIEINSGSLDAAGDAGQVGGSVSISGSDVSVATVANIAVGGTSGGSVSISSSGSTNLAGNVNAVGSQRGGGRIDVSGDSVALGATAVLNASGLADGGRVQVGGGFAGSDAAIRNSRQTIVENGALLIADSDEGDGGEVVIWSDGGTLFEGEISAQAFGSIGNGGFVEVSGKEFLEIGDAGSVTTASANGADGTFLIDPVNITVSAVGGGGTVTDVALRGFVAANNVILHTGGAGAAQGNISIFSGAKVIYDSPNSLTFLAHGDILVDGDIKNIGTTDLANTGHITLVAGWDGTLPAGLPNTSGNPQTLNDNVSSVDFINPDGSALAGRFGSWGALGSRIYFNESGLEAVEVGSARGETNIFADQIQLRHGRAEGRFTQIGYRRVADTRDTIALGGFGGYFADPTTQIVDGDINVTGLSAVRMRPSDQFNADDLNKVHARAYTMIGHGGIRRADDSVDNVGGTNGYGYDSGVIAVDDGDNSGDITVFSRGALIMEGSRLQAQTQIGHGGHGGGTPNSGNIRAGLGTAILGDMSGDIKVTAGFIDMQAGLYSDTPVQIGHGGYNVRGEFSGNVEVTSTSGSIRGQAAPNLGDAGPTNPTDWRWTNNRDRSFVQIGHGGSNSFHPDALPARQITLVNGGTNNSSFAGDGIEINPDTGLPFGHNGDITVTSAGGIHFTASGNFAYAQIGHGGNQSHGDHRGDVSVDARNGDIIFDRIAIQMDRNGMDRRNVGDSAYVQVGHGGRRASGGHTGDIDVTATGSIEFYAGRNEAYAQIGHGAKGDDSTIWAGGRQRGSTLASGTHSGDITVIAGGDVKFRSGFGSGAHAYSMIGHGGHLNWADILDTGQQTGFLSDGVTPQTLVGGGASKILVDGNGDPILDGFGKYQLVADETQQGHNGDIIVTAGGNIDFQAGQTEILPGQEPFGMEANRNENFTMIGNGGNTTWGDHWGSITLNAGGDLVLEARGGWDMITYEGTNEGSYDQSTVSANLRRAPRLSANEDNATGFRSFAMIGNGGFDSNHRVNTTQAWNSTGKRGEGIGVWGPSDINIDVKGDIVVKAAQVETLGPQIPTRAILNRDATTNTIVYTDVFGNPVSLSATVGAHVWRPDIVNRVEPNLGPATGVFLGPGGETMGRQGIEPTGFRTSSDATAANQNRFVMSGGSGFVGGEIVYVDQAGLYAGTSLDPTKAYQVFNVRVNEGDFQLREVNGNAFGATVTITTAPVAGDVRFNQTWNGWKADDPVAAASDAFAQIGNGGRSTSLTSDGLGLPTSIPMDGDGHRGNINITAGGGISILASNIDPAVATGQSLKITRIAFNGTPLLDAAGNALPDILVGPDATAADMVGTNFGTSGTDTRSQGNPSYRLYNYAMVGNGGWTARGDHQGDITIKAGKDSDGIGLWLQAGEGREDFAQIGNGGFDSDGWDPLGGVNTDNNRLNDTGSSGDISIEVDGNIIVQGGGVNTKVVGRTGTTTDTATAAAVAGSDPNAPGGLRDNGDTQYSYAQIGNGGAANGGTHSGNITVISNEGGLDVLAGNSTRYDYAQIGNGGFGARGQEHNGNIKINVVGDINVKGGMPFVDDGLTIVPGAPSTAGQIAHVHINYAHIGNGGWDSDPQAGNLNLTRGLGGAFGDIEVVSRDGNVTVQGGGDPSLTRNDDTYFRGLSAQIGNGGNFTDGDHRGYIKVVAGGDLTINGAAGGRDSYTMIGHGGLQTDGNLEGTIQVIVGGNLTMNRGADTDTSLVGNRSGQELFNNFAKIGHGDHILRTQRNDGAGTRNGDILVSVGNTLNLGAVANRPYEDAAYTRLSADQVLIGHIDSKQSDAFRSESGNTYIAVSRNNPYGGGLGNFITSKDVVFSSAGGGLFGETRFYMPDSSANFIATDTLINGTEYTRTPAPGSNRPDEQIATEHLFTTGTFGELDAEFVPEGDYPFQSFGLYNIYYGGAAPPVVTPPVDPPVVPPGPPVIPPFSFSSFFFGDTYDAYDRNGSLLSSELYRRKLVKGRKTAKSGIIYYTFDPGTNLYSSYRLFGGSSDE